MNLRSLALTQKKLRCSHNLSKFPNFPNFSNFPKFSNLFFVILNFELKIYVYSP